MDLKSNEPFFLIKNGIINSYPSLKTNKTCDVLIVGGGITGVLASHQCIKDGYETIIIDKREILNGSSSATTSMLQYEIDTPLYKLIEMIGIKGAVLSYKACLAAIEELSQIASEVHSRAGFKKKYSLYYASYKKDIAWLNREYEARKQAGFEVKWLNKNEILEQFEIHNAHAGILSKHGASVDAFKLGHEILRFNKNIGLGIFDKTELTDVVEKRGFNLCTLGTGFQIKTKKIIYCTGYETTKIIKERIVDLYSTYAIVSEIEKTFSEKYRNLLIWNTTSPYQYMRTTDDGRFLIGGEDENFVNPQKRDELIYDKSLKLIRAYQRIFKKDNLVADFSWAGTFGQTVDGLPYIGVHQDFKNSYFILGFGGNGITFSVTGMSMLSNWLRGKKHPLETYFSFGR